jgi:hypothetical protein
MFHLLPDKEKKTLEREYRYRLLLVGLCFVLATLVVASVFLFPSYILSKRKLDDVTFRNTQMKKSIHAKTDPALANFLSTLKDNLSALKSTSQMASSSVLIKDITDKKSSGIYLNQFSISNEGTTESILLSGKASNRDNLIHFYRDLQGDAHFSKVDLPISDFAKDKDISFTITISVKPNA